MTKTKESAKDCKHNLSPMILKGNHANGIIVKLGNNFTNIHEITNFDYPQFQSSSSAIISRAVFSEYTL